MIVPSLIMRSTSARVKQADSAGSALGRPMAVEHAPLKRASLRIMALRPDEFYSHALPNSERRPIRLWINSNA